MIGTAPPTSWRHRAAEDPERVLRQVALGIVAVIGVVVPVVAVLSSNEPERSIATVAAVTLTLIVAVAAAFALLGASGLPATNGHSGWLLAGSLVAWTVGSGAWALSHAGVPGTEHVGDAAFVLTVVMYSMAIVGHPMLAPPTFRRRAAIDGVILGLSVTAVVWLVAGRALQDRTGDSAATAAALSYILADVALAVICLWALTRLDRHDRLAGSARLLAMGFALIAAGDVNQVIARAHGGTGTISWLATEIAWGIGVCCLATAIWVARGSVETRHTRVDRVRLRGALESVSVGAVVLVSLLTATGWVLDRTVDPVGMALLSVLILLVLWRSALTLDRTEQLAASLSRSVDELAQQATHDRLTGLPNRSGLTDQISSAITTSARSHHHVALMFVDIDHLKPVNDALGHAAGDELICTVAERLMARLGGGVTRFGGDEFVVLVDDAPSTRAIDSLARSIVTDSASPTTISGHTVRPSVSVGYAIAEVGDDPDELLRRADVALYRAKSSGRRRVATYDPANPDDARRQVDLVPELRRALRDDEFEVHYQPIVELATGRIAAVESLLRWRHPTRGVLTPPHFLDEAASAGLLGEIGARTFAKVCRDHATTGIRCSVNLSTSELTDRRVVERVRHALASSGHPPSLLTIEITEDVIVDSTVRRTIDELRELGVQLAIDDFGTGNSSLRQLGTYPAGTIKVDRSFISRLDEDPAALAITGAVVRLGHRLGMVAVAEGVETPEQRSALIELGCEYAQGWWFSRAVPYDELVQLLESGAVLPATGSAPPANASSTSDASDTIRSSSSATGGRSSIAPTT